MRWFDVLARDGDTAALLDLLKSPFCLPGFAHRGGAIALMERQIRREAITGGWARLRHLFAERRANATLVDAETMDADEAQQATRAGARALIATLADEAAAWPRGLAQKPPDGLAGTARRHAGRARYAHAPRRRRRRPADARRRSRGWPSCPTTRPAPMPR